MSNEYPIDLVLNETHEIIEELKTQLNADTTRLSRLEAMIPSNQSYNDSNDYAAPAWFGS